MNPLSPSLLTGILWIGASAAANAQTVHSGTIHCKGYDDGFFEGCDKPHYPSDAGDYLNVDFNADCAGDKMVAICVGTCEMGVGGVHGSISVNPDNLAIDPSGATPDLSAPITIVGHPTGLPGTFCTDLVAYDVPDVVLGSTPVHAVYGFEPGDRAVYVCVDLTSPESGRSYGTTDGYATPARPIALDWAIRLGVIPDAAGVLWINGATSTTVRQNAGPVCFLFTGCTSGQMFLLFLTNCSGGLQFPALRSILTTGVGSVDDAGTTASICANYTCALPAPLTVCFAAVYLDPCNPKPNGQPRIGISNEVTLVVTPSSICSGYDVCYGQKDDGILDSTIWKIANPAGSGDYFNVHYGVGSGVTNLTNLEAASWDFCISGTGPSWGSILSAIADTAFDPSGGTPNIATPIASATTLNMGSGQSDWAYPATFYDYPDVPYRGEDLHGVVHWPSGDSCIWLGSDTDFVDSTCGVNGASYFTLDNYNTIAIQFHGAAWMIKQDWN